MVIVILNPFCSAIHLSSLTWLGSLPISEDQLADGNDVKGTHRSRCAAGEATWIRRKGRVRAPLKLLIGQNGFGAK